GYCAKGAVPLIGKRLLAGSARSWRHDFVYLRAGLEGMCFYMFQPVVRGGAVVGILACDRITQGEEDPEAVQGFTKSDQDFMQSAVDVLSLDWRRKRATEIQRQSNELLTTFLRIISKLSATLNIEEVATLLVLESKRLLNYETAGVALASEDGTSYTLISGEGFEFNPQTLIGQDAKTWAQWCISSADDTLLISDFQKRKSPMAIYAPDEIPLEVGSFLAIPLGVPPRRRGAFLATHRKGGQFHPETEQFLRILCRHASVLVENAITHRQMEELAVTDELTRLPNHRCFQDRLDEELSRARRNKTPLSLLMIDIDHFKKLNDTYGHPFGDVVLGQVADIIERCLRMEDFAGRYGGEEFALILPDTNRDGARQSAERLRAEVNRTLFTHEGISTRVTISGGLATYPKDAGAKVELIENADRALYFAKRSGRNRIAQYHVIHAMQLPIEFQG
ncbi:MAG: diguanylate cyclase, partial [Acidobacteriia bacterium]|nr:diguanylate cyclase [Terriglobia bacterium]